MCVHVYAHIYIYTHIRTYYMHIYIYIYIHMCIERERERETYIYIYIHTLNTSLSLSIYIYIYTCMHIYIYIHTCTHLCISLFLSLSLYIYIYIYIHTYIYIYIYTYIFIYIHIYIYIHTHMARATPRALGMSRNHSGVNMMAPGGQTTYAQSPYILNIVPTKIAWLKLSGKFPMGLVLHSQVAAKLAACNAHAVVMAGSRSCYQSWRLREFQQITRQPQSHGRQDRATFGTENVADESYWADRGRGRRFRR